jgi:hypothetical protein
LFEYLSHATDAGVLRVPCVTNQNDAADDGQIGAAGQGYGVAAVTISQSSVDNVFNAPPGLSGKNIAGTSREYEMATRQNGPAYGDLVAELTYGDLYNKVCGTQKTKIRIQNYSGVNLWANVNGAGCVPVQGAPVGFIDIFQGTTIIFYSDALCSSFCGPVAPGTRFTFNMSAVNTDAGNVDWNSGAALARDGRVQIPAGATCAALAVLTDNTNAAP